MADNPPTKDPIASAMAKKRWDKTTKEERSAIARDLAAARWGKKNKTSKKAK